MTLSWPPPSLSSSPHFLPTRPQDSERVYLSSVRLPALTKTLHVSESCIVLVSFFPSPPPFSPSRKKKSNSILYVISHSSHSASLLLLLHWSLIQTTELKPGSAFYYLFHFKQIPTDPLILYQCVPGSGKNNLTLIMEGELLWESQSLGSFLSQLWTNRLYRLGENCKFLWPSPCRLLSGNK